jgi:hypothetical protein
MSAPPLYIYKEQTIHKNTSTSKTLHSEAHTSEPTTQ